MTIVIEALSDRKRVVVPSLAAAGGLILSKGLALSPGFSIDDYALAQEPLDPRHFLSQVRPLLSAVVWAIDAMDVTLVSISWLGTLVSIIALALFLGVGLRYADPEQAFRTPLTAAAAFLIACHPYLAEIFTFRQSTPLLAVAASLMVLTVLVMQKLADSVRDTTPWAQLLVAAFLLTSLGLSGQTPLVLVTLFILARPLNAAMRRQADGVRTALTSNRYGILALAMGASTYILIHLVITRLITPNESGTRSLIGFKDIPQRIEEGAQHVATLMLGEQPVIPRALTILMTLLVAFVLLGVLIASRRAAVHLALMLLILTSVALAPILVASAWWPVPRSMYGVAFSTGIVIASASVWLRPIWASIATILSVAVGIGLMMQSNAILSDQQRLNRWDLLAAQSVASALGERGVGPGDDVVVVGFPWAYPVGLTTVQGDLNVSAMAVSWSAQALLREATGVRWTVSVRPRDVACEQVGPEGPGFEGAFDIVKTRAEVLVCYRSLG